MDGAGGSSGGAAAAAGAGVVPASAIEAVNQTLAILKELKPQLEQLFSLASDPEVLAALEPLQQAKAMHLLAEATTTLYTLQLRCKGIDPENHRVKSEIERINVYREKFQKCLDQSKEPLRPTTVLNRQAATRFIEHSLPDLTSTQKQNIRDLSKGDKSRIRNSETTARKRKYQSNEKQSVQSAAKDFLEKAAREIIGNNENGLKGPLMAAGDGSDDVEVGTA